MKSKKSIIFLAVFLATVISFSFKTEVKAEFNPNRIMEDHVLLNTGSMTLQEIQNFLASRNSFLANYTTEAAYGGTKSAAQIIYDAANNNYDCTGITLSDNPDEEERRQKCRHITTVNPQFLIVLLQKEQSLIQNPNPSQKALDEATGYGCPTGGVCSPYWKGFGKQVNSAALQFRAYMNNPARYNFKVGSTYIAKDRFSMLKELSVAINDGTYNSIVSSPDLVTVTIENQATAAMYTYTPHVYNGNFNVYRLMNIYFPESNSIPEVPVVKVRRNFPNGSILKAENKPEIWLIENGQKRHFANWASFISRFRDSQIVIATDEEINHYPTGAQIKFANYALVQTPDEKIYLLVGREKRPFESIDVFRRIGFNPEELQEASYEELSGFVVGKTITNTSTYITGVLFEDNSNGKIYHVENGVKHLVDPVLIGTKYIDRQISKKTTSELNSFETGDPILLDDGSLVMTSNFPRIYLISEGKKRPFASDQVFETLGYNRDNVIVASSQFLYNYPMGETINQ